MRLFVSARKRILLVAEAVSLAHLARPMALGLALDPLRHDITLACDPRWQAFFTHLPWRIRPISSIGSERFLAALAKGRPIYDLPTLRDYAREDLAVIDEIRPDLVVGDFRLSLSVSARVAKVPYMTVTNAYWSPYARQRFTLPEHPLIPLLGLPVAQALFNLVRPLAFAYHALPLNRLRREYRLPLLGPDLRKVYTDADVTLYADVPELVPTWDLPSHHHYLGPVLWSPPGEKPDWWEKLPNDRPVVYVTLGSSGQGYLLPMVLSALDGLPLTVIAATAGRSSPIRTGNAYVADYLPGMEAAARASLVICNGGSPTSQQAFAAGVPVLGIAGNLDQFLNMAAACSFGAARLLRSDQAAPDLIRRYAQTLLDTPAFSEAASRLSRVFQQYPAGERFAALVASALGETRD